MQQDKNAATDFLDALNLTPIVDKLGSINSTLNDLMLDRNVETADKEAVGTVPDARLNSDSAYHRLTSAVELAAFTAVPAVQTVINNFIDVLNSLVEQFKRVIAGKEAKNSSGSNEIEEEVVIVE
jgi:chemotaxis regulatin CheY-phosphate phosphatase CheZ